MGDEKSSEHFLRKSEGPGWTRGLFVFSVRVLIVSLSPRRTVYKSDICVQDIVKTRLMKWLGAQLCCFIADGQDLKIFSQTNLSFIGHSFGFSLLFVSGDSGIFSNKVSIIVRKMKEMRHFISVFQLSAISSGMNGMTGMAGVCREEVLVERAEEVTVRSVISGGVM